MFCQPATQVIVFCSPDRMKTVVAVVLISLPAVFLAARFEPSAVCGRPESCLRPQCFDCDSTCAEQAPHFVLLTIEVGRRRNRRIAGRNRRRTIKTHCGGSLITDRHVVTAAHCIINRGKFDMTSEDYPNDLVAYIGVTDRYSDKKDGKEKRAIRSIAVHEEWHGDIIDNLSDGHDLAVLELMEPISITRRVRPVCLPHKDDSRLINGRRNVTLTGFGKVEGDRDSSELQRGELEIVDEETCQAHYRKGTAQIPIEGSQLCATGRWGSATTSCKGDSGSGLVTHDYVTNRETLVGVVSYGASRCGGGGKPSVYTNIVDHVDWINNIINKSLPISNIVMSN